MAVANVLERLVNIRRLPSLPATALRVLELAAKPDVSVAEISSVIANDPAIAARLLRYANSPFVAARREITNIPAAVVALGMRAVKVTALGFSLIRKQDFSRCPRFNFDLFWAHASATATAAHGIAAIGVPHLRDDAFVAGLLARIGKLVFATAMPEEYDKVLARTGNVMHFGIREEDAAFGTNSIEVGAELLAGWNLPSLLVGAIRHQMNPDAAPTADMKHLANAVQHGGEIANVLCGLVSEAQSAAVERLISNNLDEMQQQFRELAALLDISLKDLPEPDEIEDRARGFAEEISVATQAENVLVNHKNQELEEQTRTDALTGIANRRAFDERLAAELERARRYGHPLSLLIADIDRFKQVNDTYGHVAGDGVLKTVAARMKAVLRNCDFLARCGGDEFGVIAAETDLEAARQLAERLRSAIEETVFGVPSGTQHVTISIGVAAAISAQRKVDAQALIAAADSTLYDAKRAGRNRCCGIIFGV